ncbi:hypothetical protein L7F22_064204 [Adiantum nelumboides]|nr:hypothetical protein [Adiantum nelumboides]
MGRGMAFWAENGSGKTTFLEALANRDVEIPEHVDIYLVQGEAPPSDVNALDFIIKSAKEKVARLEKEIEDMSAADEVDEVGLDLKMEELDDLDPSTFEAKAGAILHGSRFQQADDGQAHKGSLRWMENACLAGPSAVHQATLASPRRANEPLGLGGRCLARGLPLDLQPHSRFHVALGRLYGQRLHQHHGLTMQKKMVYYGGNYSIYVRDKERERGQPDEGVRKQQEEIAHIKKFIASAGTYANLVKQAKSKQKIIDKMEAAGLIEAVQQPRPLRFNFEDVRKLPPRSLPLTTSLSATVEKRRTFCTRISASVSTWTREWPLLGKNGTGKSTLLNLITGVLQPVKGSVQRHAGLKLGKYSQHSADQLPYDKSPLEYMESRYKDKFPGKEMQFWRQQIGRFGLSGTHQTSAIRTLSDGLRNESSSPSWPWRTPTSCCSTSRQTIWT